MHNESILIECLYFLVATLVFIPIFRLARLGSTLGYLTAGLTLGPSFLGVIDNDTFIIQLGDIGLILLLFVIGLELSPRRLSQLKSRLIKEGSAQFIITTAIITFIAHYSGLTLISALLVASAFTLSSTAFVLFYLKETKQITYSYGQSAFGILLLQDLVVVPLLALIPLLAQEKLQMQGFSSFHFASMVVILIAALLFGKFALKPFVSLVHRKTNHEVFSATCLVIVLGSSLLFYYIGLSYALGAFVAGIFLADSEFKQEVENVILPFKGMLLGTFFMSFGLQFDMSFVKQHFALIIFFTFSLYALKSSLLFVIGYLRFSNIKKSLKLSLVMGQGGEFGIVLLATALSYELITPYLFNLTTSIILMSLFFAPLVARCSELSFLKETPIPQEPDFSPEPIKHDLEIVTKEAC